MSSATQNGFAKDSWQTPRNARTFRALMALRNEEIGQRLAQLRERKGNPPQEVVAAEVGVSYRSYQAWETGETKPSWRNLTKLADYYGTTAEFILVGNEDGSFETDDETVLAEQPPWAARLEEKLDAVLQHQRERDEQIDDALTHLSAGLGTVAAENLLRTREQEQQARRDTGR
jgi:transcriptional regulator with XRE-family HTH domain